MDSTIHNLASSSSEYIRIISEYYNYNVSEYVLNDLIVYLSTNQNHQNPSENSETSHVWHCSAVSLHGIEHRWSSFHSTPPEVKATYKRCTSQASQESDVTTVLGLSSTLNCVALVGVQLASGSKEAWCQPRPWLSGCFRGTLSVELLTI